MCLRVKAHSPDRLEAYSSSAVLSFSVDVARV